MVRDLSTTHSQIVQTMNLTESLGHLSLLCHKRFGNGLRSLANVHVLSKFRHRPDDEELPGRPAQVGSLRAGRPVFHTQRQP